MQRLFLLKVYLAQVQKNSKMEFFGLYEVRDILGQGRFGDVIRCVNKGTRMVYAMKEKQYTDENQKTRIQQELKILRELSHLNIVQLHGVYPACSAYYLVIELACGGELLNDLVTRTTFSENTAREIFSQLLGAVAYLHELRIVHRNVRPEKLLLSWKSEPGKPFPPLKLTGFGLARKLPDNSDTMQCALEGSPLYLAPETVNGDNIGRAVDIWACATILYILLAGYPPFWSTNQDELLTQIAKGSLRFPDKEWKSLSPAAKLFITGMLTVDPNRRLTAHDALNDLWARNESLPRMHRRHTLENLHTFNAKRKIKGAVHTIFAMGRMQQL